MATAATKTMLSMISI